MTMHKQVVVPIDDYNRNVVCTGMGWSSPNEQWMKIVFYKELKDGDWFSSTKTGHDYHKKSDEHTESFDGAKLYDETFEPNTLVYVSQYNSSTKDIWKQTFYYEKPQHEAEASKKVILPVLKSPTNGDKRKAFLDIVGAQNMMDKPSSIK